MTSPAQVSVSGHSFWVYADHASLTEYAVGSLAHASAYLAASADTQKVAMVTATRQMDAESWTGAKTTTSQPLAWPRTGVTDREGSAVASGTIPADIVNGFFELALALIADPSLATAGADPASAVKSISDGKTSLTFWSPQNAGGRFPSTVQALLGPYLSGSAAAVGLGAPTLLSDSCAEKRFGAAGRPAFDEDEFGVTES